MGGVYVWTYSAVGFRGGIVLTRFPKTLFSVRLKLAVDPITKRNSILTTVVIVLISFFKRCGVQWLGAPCGGRYVFWHVLLFLLFSRASLELVISNNRVDTPCLRVVGGSDIIHFAALIYFDYRYFDLKNRLREKTTSDSISLVQTWFAHATLYETHCVKTVMSTAGLIDIFGVWTRRL